MIGKPFPVNEQGFTGLAATNAMTVSGIKSTDNLVAVYSFTPASGLVIGRDITDFTVGSGTLTAGTIDLSSTDCWAIWTSAPAS